MSNKHESTERHPWRGDPYWKYEVTLILLDSGATALPDLSYPDDDTGKKVLVASRVRLKYVVRRIRKLKKDYEEPQLSEQVHDFLDQARLQDNGAYWRELDHEYHARGMFML